MSNNDSSTKRKPDYAAYSLHTTSEGTRWTKIGVAFTQKNNGIGILYDAIPQGHRIQLRQLDRKPGGAAHVGDGIPNAWRAAHFGGSGTTTNSSSCAACDPDHDGLTNLQEFLAGTDPNNAASALHIGLPAKNGADVIVSFPSVSGIIYRVEVRNDITGGNWIVLADQIVGKVPKDTIDKSISKLITV